jgi:membrane protease YdiL (CAAX protease family)
VIATAAVIGIPNGVGWLAAYVYRTLVPGAEIPVPALLVLVLALTHVSYVCYVRLIEWRAAEELSPRAMFPDLGWGILTGACLCGAVVGVLWLLGYYGVTAVNGLAATVPLFAASVVSAYVEEIVARGIVFRIMEEGLGTWLALAGSAILFGLVHIFNPNATILGALAIALTAGVILGAGYVLTRTLWLPIGIHFAWNFTLGGIFGLAVSGRAGRGFVDAELSGPELLSGGTFGPEASLFVILFGLPIGGYLLLRAIQRNQIRPPAWSRHPEATDPGGIARAARLPTDGN